MTDDRPIRLTPSRAERRRIEQIQAARAGQPTTPPPWLTCPECGYRVRRDAMEQHREQCDRKRIDA